ncbi:hypothetical protein Hte_010422 [Hypoxylon texense]
MTAHARVSGLGLKYDGRSSPTALSPRRYDTTSTLSLAQVRGAPQEAQGGVCLISSRGSVTGATFTTIEGAFRRSSGIRAAISCALPPFHRVQRDAVGRPRASRRRTRGPPAPKRSARPTGSSRARATSAGAGLSFAACGYRSAPTSPRGPGPRAVRPREAEGSVRGEEGSARGEGGGEGCEEAPWRDTSKVEKKN